RATFADQERDDGVARRTAGRRTRSDGHGEAVHADREGRGSRTSCALRYGGGRTTAWSTDEPPGGTRRARALPGRARYPRRSCLLGRADPEVRGVEHPGHAGAWGHVHPACAHVLAAAHLEHLGAVYRLPVRL